MMDDDGYQHDAIGYISTLFLMESVRVNDDDNSGDSDYGSSRINDIIDKEEEDGTNNNKPFQTQIRRGRQTLVAYKSENSAELTATTSTRLNKIPSKVGHSSNNRTSNAELIFQKGEQHKVVARNGNMPPPPSQLNFAKRWMPISKFQPTKRRSQEDGQEEDSGNDS